jgi:hypothetical protein
MGHRVQKVLSKNPKATLARITVASLLVLMALPVVYLGIWGISALFYAISLNSVLFILTPAFVILSAFGTLLSFRYALMTAAALAVFYLGWAVTVFPFSGLLPNLSFFWVQVTMFVVLCLNLAWIVWSLRGRRALGG